MVWEQKKMTKAGKKDDKIQKIIDDYFDALLEEVKSRKEN